MADEVRRAVREGHRQLALSDAEGTTAVWVADGALMSLRTADDTEIVLNAEEQDRLHEALQARAEIDGDPHAGMMTRRECLERWAFVDRKSRTNSELTGYATEAYVLRNVLGARGVDRQELCHELALLIDPEEDGET